MKKLYFAIVALLLCAISASAVTITSGTKLYLTPNDNWKQSNARFAAYFFSDTGNAWVSMTKVAGETDLYEVTSPAGKNFTNVIFCRMNPSTTANNWNNKWNQTADLTYDGTKNRYTVKADTWDNGGGTWSVYTPGVVVPAETMLYLKPNSKWLADGAWFAAYFFGNGEAWATMTDSNSDGIYECAVPNPGNFTHMIFVRLNPAGATPNWDNKWSQTIDLTWDGTNNLYTLNDGSWENGIWSKHEIDVEPETIIAESISLDKSEISLFVEETVELTATILPELTTDKSVVWTSSDEAVAIVDKNGVVTAIGAGEATITATTADGSNLSTTCKVDVKLLIPEVGTTFEYENLKYEVTVAGKEVAVTGLIDSSYSGEIIIPESVIFNGITYSVTSIGDYAFQYCYATSVVIGNSVTIIGDHAFAGCDVTSVVIGNSVTLIGDYAFAGCDATSVVIGNSVTIIGDHAFFDCPQLASIEISNSVTSIRDYAFAGCDVLSSIIVREGNPVYDSRENCNAIIETETNRLIVGCMNSFISNSVNLIGVAAFYGCPGLTSIEIPNSVTAIEREAFYSCTSLESVVIGNSVTSISDYAFSCCYGLTSIEIPNSVTSIGHDAFSNCEGLTSAVIGNSVTSIGVTAFNRCIGLTSIECLAEVPPTIEEYTFENYSCELYVPYGCKSAYQSAEYWQNFTNIIELDPDYILGDANGDGCLDVMDIVNVAQCIVGNVPDNFSPLAGDYNEDGSIDVFDIVNMAIAILNENSVTSEN